MVKCLKQIKEVTIIMPYQEGAAEEFTAAKVEAAFQWVSGMDAAHAELDEQILGQRANYQQTLNELKSEYVVLKSIDKETYMAGKRTAAGIFVAAKKSIRDSYKVTRKALSLTYRVAKNAAKAAYKAQFFRS